MNLEEFRERLEANSGDPLAPVTLPFRDAVKLLRLAEAVEHWVEERAEYPTEADALVVLRYNRLVKE